MGLFHFSTGIPHMTALHPGSKLKKDVGFFGLLFAGVGGMIGSGWLKTLVLFNYDVPISRIGTSLML